MKFKTIFILFNAAVILSFAFIFAMPAIMLDPSFASIFWAKNWPLGLAFLIVLTGLNLFFGLNWRVFELLEREDWPALTHHLRGRIIVSGRIGARDVRIYLNALLLLSDTEAISELEAKLAAVRPRMLARYSLLFGLSRLLKGDYQGAAGFMLPYVGNKDVESADWLRFDCGFARALGQEWGEALTLFEQSLTAKSMVIRAMAASYIELISPRLGPEESKRLKALVSSFRADFLAKHSQKGWKKAVDKEKSEIQGIVLCKLMDDVATWLYGASNAQAGDGARLQAKA